MQIWVDADACPNAIKEVLFRAAEKRGITTTLVANQFIRTPRSKVVSSITVEHGFDVADDFIVERVASGDLVITADVPLASSVIDKGGHALNPRGTLYTSDNVKSHLARRDLAEQLRDLGTVTGGPPPIDKADIQKFANALDRLLTRGNK